MKILTGIAAALVLSAAASALKTLTADNFEHDTQAATGQTTGVWLIRFCTFSSAPCQSMQDEWEELAEEMLEEQIFLADIDADASPRLAERFQITTNPTYILLRNRKMYTKGPSTGIEELKNWALKDWQQTLDSMVPPETEKFDVMAVISEMVEKGRINFRNLVAASKSEDKAVRLKAQAHLALPVLVSCLIALLAILVKVGPGKAKTKGDPKRGKQD
ncbi:hypothetical protein Ndes2526B_g00428 [Nannochloris sp. 'desiccata']|nr:hypothetical protein KSW81_003200 [Chlorella desiccata (nom. nud.)]KAH7625047.1 putative Thioredoxin domain-containing protein [Chlorella desiccata (nom. nud.)]